MTDQTNSAEPSLSPNVIWLSAFLLVLGLVCSWYFVEFLGRFGESFEREALLAEASTAAASFDGAEVARLKGSAEDLSAPVFRETRGILQRMRTAIPHLRLARLMALRNTDVIFLSVAEPEGSPNYASPGAVYIEASPTLRRVFATGTAAVEGPFSDHWGERVSGLAPVWDPRTGKIVAVIGLDMSAAHWRATISHYRWLAIAISGFLGAALAIFGLLLYVQYRLGRKLEIANHIVEQSTSILYRLTCRPYPQMTFISSNIAKLGYQVSEFIVAPEFYLSLVHPRDRTVVEELLGNAIADVSFEPRQFRIRAKDGSYRWVENHMAAIKDKAGHLLALEGMLLDITEAKLANEKLQFSNTLLSTEMETSPDGILVVNERGRIISFNRRFGTMFGIPTDVLQAGDDAPVLAAVTAAVKDPVAFESRVRHLYAHTEETGCDELETKDGRYLQRHTAALLTDSGGYLGRVWFFRDITLYREVEAEIRRTTRYDGLTGLANRRLFMEEVQQVINRAGRGEKRFAVLYMDLDHFKDVNDTMGHPMGDALLCAVAERLELTVRETDFVARFGGDEFGVITTGLDDPADAANLAERLIMAISAPFSIRGTDIHCGVSIGIAVYDPESDDPDTMLSHADVALYRAKSDGRGGYRFFTNMMDTDVRTRVTLIAELREAIASDQLFLQYQPQVEIETGRIVGVEALVRWRHPQRGIVAPGEFIHIAELSGLIVALERWVIREACRQAKAWLDGGMAPIVMSVNVSGVQFKAPLELEKDVAAVLAVSGFPAHLLALELTESVLMEASREHIDVMLRLRQSGIKLAIDDFGTGYSSFAYLNRYPTAHVKIAQEFVQQIAFDAGSAAIVRAIIGLSRELGMVSVAEGVETAEQLVLLKGWGCRQVQGFYFSTPLDPEALAPILRVGRIPEQRPSAAKTAA